MTTFKLDPWISYIRARYCSWCFWNSLVGGKGSPQACSGLSLSGVRKLMLNMKGTRSGHSQMRGWLWQSQALSYSLLTPLATNSFKACTTEKPVSRVLSAVYSRSRCSAQSLHRSILLESWKIIISHQQLLSYTCKPGYLLSLNLAIVLSALVVTTLEMKQCGRYTQSMAKSASIINAPYKCWSQRIKEMQDKLKALRMKGKAFSATNGSSLLNTHHTGKCWCLQEYYHLSHPSAHRNRLATEFLSQILIHLYWWKSGVAQTSSRVCTYITAAGQILLSGALQQQDRIAAVMRTLLL